MYKRIVWGALAVFLLLTVSACGTIATGTMETSKISIEKDKAKELELELSIAAGEMIVTNGADEWVEGTIEYNIDKFMPDVSYQLKDGKGIGVIEQAKKVNTTGKIKNKWELNLNKTIPIDLIVNSGASQTKLDLKGLKLRSLEVDAGVGDITIDLGGKWKNSFDASFELGIGKSTIILPRDVGVKIDSSKGIGKLEMGDFISKGDGIYVNEAYENADIIINLKTELGIGEAIFELE
ncbi:MAG: toast rack family protein [Bacillus sp. (in: Bacteria)]|nr:toast rack family protein [Bacillus sp. (in: firmicutes)]